MELALLYRAIGRELVSLESFWECLFRENISRCSLSESCDCKQSAKWGQRDIRKSQSLDGVFLARAGDGHTHPHWQHFALSLGEDCAWLFAVWGNLLLATWTLPLCRPYLAVFSSVELWATTGSVFVAQLLGVNCLAHHLHCWCPSKGEWVQGSFLLLCWFGFGRIALKHWFKRGFSFYWTRIFSPVIY